MQAWLCSAWAIESQVKNRMGTVHAERSGLDEWAAADRYMIPMSPRQIAEFGNQSA